MPRVPNEAEEDALAEAEDDRAESYEELDARRGGTPAKPALGAAQPRVIHHDDRGMRTPAGVRPFFTEEAGPLASIDDLSPAARAALKAARDYQVAARKRQEEEDDAIERGDDDPNDEPTPAAADAADPAASTTPPPQAPAPAAAAAPPVETSPVTPAEAPAEPKLDQNLVAAWEQHNAQKLAFEADRKQWTEATGTAQAKLDAILEKFDWDPVGALRDIAAMRLGSEDATKLQPVIDEVYDDLTGQRLGIEADEGRKAKREARRNRVELGRYQREQRAEAERTKRETEAERTRATVERESQQIATWLSVTPKDSYAWLRTNENASALVRDVQDEFKRHGQVVSVDQAAAFADKQLKEYAQAHFNRFKHLLAPDQAPASPAAAPAGAVPTQAPNQPATPPSATTSQRPTRTLTNTAAATTPTRPPPTEKSFDPKEDTADARMRSLARWKAKQKAQQQPR